jgi:hypothetical protein
MSSDVTNLYDDDGALRYALAPKVPVKRSQALISRTPSFFAPRTLMHGGKR